jgi:nucleotide-binding universal stress UspA family protein
MTASTPNVVAGVDGSDSSRQALEWAVEEATRRNLPLHILCAWRSDYTAETVAPVIAGIADDSRSIVDAAAAHARTVSPGLDVSSSTVRAQAASALIAASRHADTVVVGAHGTGALAEVLLGSTSLQLAAYASCPVVVVREPPTGQVGPRRVVVGVDGSDLSTEATGYAFEQASGRGLGLTVLHAWNANEYTSGVALTALSEPWRELAAEQERITSEAIAQWAATFPNVDVLIRVTQGRPADVLVDASAGAELVVVGSRGRGGFRGLLLGSVSRSVLHQAHCPVAVLRRFSPDDSDDSDDSAGPH